MESKEKSVLYNKTIENIEKSLNIIENELGRESVLNILAHLVGEQELYTASNLIKKGYEPGIDKEYLSEQRYSEGNEDAGFIDLSLLLKYAEEILNCDDNKNYGDIEFQYFVRKETQEEMKENERDENVTWYTEDESKDIEKLQIQFGMF